MNIQIHATLTEDELREAILCYANTKLPKLPADKIYEVELNSYSYRPVEITAVDAPLAQEEIDTYEVQREILNEEKRGLSSAKYFEQLNEKETA